MTLEEDMKELIEQMTALEHEQWVQWSQQITATETISPDRLKRWEKLWIPYSDLTEEQKDQDREWARKSFDIARDFAEYL